MPVRQPINIQPKSILVITLRYLGDTLLVTPLINSLKKAYPDAEIDVLLPASNLGMFEGNHDVSKLILMSDKKEKFGFGKLLFSLFRRYDLAISTQGGDRPVLCAIMAGKLSMSFIADTTSKYSWKRHLPDWLLEVKEQHLHPVLENLRFCQLLNIEPSYILSLPRESGNSTPYIPSEKFAVLHMMPQWTYKQWHEEGWIKVGQYLDRMGLVLVLTGSSQASEMEMVKALQGKLPPSTRNLAGQLSLAQLTMLIEKAALFLGPDTGITHLAAATGVRTVALYGPTDPEKWAPWPSGYMENVSPFASKGRVQQNNNVCVVQGVSEKACVPCQLEGCNRNRQSNSECLDNLTGEAVIEILHQLL